MHPPAIFWAAATIGLYAGSLRLHRRLHTWWSSPMLVTWTLCAGLLWSLHATYRDYLGGTGWLAVLIGPATIAFAIPIHENRRMIRAHWPLLLIGAVVGSTIAMGSAWALARLFHFTPQELASLLPRSITTPFAVSVSKDLGGLPELTATFTAITGLFGATIGEGLLLWLPLRSAFARGALLGMGAHSIGVAKARELGEEEGAIAGLMMIFAGLLNVFGVLLFVNLR